MRELIDAKIDGKQLVQTAEVEEQPIMDITAALKASIENASKSEE